MLKKLLLAGAVTLAGSTLAPEKADAQVVYGPVVRYGTPVYRAPSWGYRTYPRYRYNYRAQPVFPGPAFRAPAYRGPIYGPAYRSYRPSWGAGRYYVPRSSGFSLRIGPSYGW